MKTRKTQKKVFCLIIFTITFLPSNIIAQQKSIDKEKLKQAEQLADKFVRRFAETLDFGVCYREFFVTNKAVKQKCVINQVKDSVDDSVKGTIDEKLIEDVYVSYLSNFYLSTLFIFNIKNVFDYEDEVLVKKIPLEMRKSLQKDFNNFTSGGHFNFKNVGEIHLFLQQINKSQKLYKKYLPKKPFTNSIYKKNIKQFYLGSLVPNCKYDGQVYTVIREMFYLFIVEEDGEFRVLGVATSN